MAKLNWERAAQREREAKKTGSKPPPLSAKKKRRRKSKKVHPNSTAARIWGRTKWRR